MDLPAVVAAILVGAIQGLLEWLPVSSEGGVALALTLVGGERPDLATRLALVLHAGTAVAALAFYREEVGRLLGDLSTWRAREAFAPEGAELTFLGVATLVSGVVGAGVYVALFELVSALQGGVFVALVGVLLVATGAVQRAADQGRDQEQNRGQEQNQNQNQNQNQERERERERERDWGRGRGRGRDAVAHRDSPDALDAVVVGALQGLALLPGVSRSGTTVSALLLRGHSGEASLRLSFLLSIPASLGAGALVYLDEGLPVLAPALVLVALATSAVVGYLTVSALVGLVRRVAFWGVCVGFGSLAILGGLLLVL